MACGANWVADWSTCVGNRAANSPTGGWPSSPTAGTNITAALVNNFVSCINTELSAWRVHRYWTGAPSIASVGAGGSAQAAYMNTFVNALSYIGVGTAGFSVGQKITASDYITLMNAYNTARNNCICNTDCNCNSVCVCNIDCGCNYSDKRLKREIQYC